MRRDGTHYHPATGIGQRKVVHAITDRAIIGPQEAKQCRVLRHKKPSPIGGQKPARLPRRSHRTGKQAHVGIERIQSAAEIRWIRAVVDEHLVAQHDRALHVVHGCPHPGRSRGAGPVAVRVRGQLVGREGDEIRPHRLSQRARAEARPLALAHDDPAP